MGGGGGSCLASGGRRRGSGRWGGQCVEAVARLVPVAAGPRGLTVLAGGSVAIAGGFEGATELEVGADVVWLDGQRLAKAPNRVGSAALVDQELAEVHPHVDIVRSKGCGT